MLRISLQSIVFKAFTAVAIALPALGGLAAPVEAAPIIGWNFVYTGAGQTTNGTVNPEHIAGAPGFEQANWNNHLSAGSAVGSVPQALVDSTGAATGVSLVAATLQTNNSYYMDQDGTPSTPDERLVHSYLSNTGTLTFEGLDSFAPEGYTVVIYYARGGNRHDTAGFTVNGVHQSVTYSRPTSGYHTHGYILHDGTGDSNYVVFEGATGDVLSIAQDSGLNNFGIAAVQIVANAIPEPASIALMGVGGLLMLRRRKN